MLSTPLEQINRDCLLWQVDAEDLWSVEQILRACELFRLNPGRTAAYYYCHTFVGPKLVVTARETDSNGPEPGGLRTWRFSPGCQWSAGEPPRLRRRDGSAWTDLATACPIWHGETEAHNLVFQRFAYATRRQMASEERRYGRIGAPEGWQRLQNNRRFPVHLRDFLPWVSEQARVDRVKSLGVSPLARRSILGGWRFSCHQPAGDPVPALVPRNDPDRILFVRIDSIGDAVLAASVLPHLRRRFPTATLGVLCQEHLRELYETCPAVNAVLTVNLPRLSAEKGYRKEMLARIERFQPDLVLNTTRSRSAWDEVLTLSNSAPEKIGIESDFLNIPPPDRRRWLPYYTRVIPSPGLWKPELERHKDFLNGLNVEVETLAPMVWTTGLDDAFADAVFEKHQLRSVSTIALCPFAQHESRYYPHYVRALERLVDYRFIILGGSSNWGQCQELVGHLPGSVNVAGKTTLCQMASILRKCRLYVGAESAGAHISCAVGTPNVVVLGGGYFGRFLPYSPLTSTVSLPLSCFGCKWGCRYQRAHCIKDLDPACLHQAILRSLSEPASKPRVFTQRKLPWPSNIGQPSWHNCAPFLADSEVEAHSLGEADPTRSFCADERAKPQAVGP